MKEDNKYSDAKMMSHKAREHIVFIDILKAIDGGFFEEWIAGLREQIPQGGTIDFYYIKGNLVSKELIMSVKASPEIYREYLKKQGVKW